jgi:ABC-type Zn uptake system ZnuABC Zn-binding protein ZnuA
MASPRETEAEVLVEIRKYLGTPEIILVRKWMETMLEGIKDDFVNCSPDELHRIQAEALVYKNILRKLDRAAYKQDQYLKQQLAK